jgi:cation diffusion facilitator CzcD-associated flavoprotein CzcO
MKTVVIIGAGPAGITAAKELASKKSEYNIILLEESNEIGGISRTIKFHENRMDIGGHRFFSKDERVMQWWRDIMPVQGDPSMDDKILGREKQFSPGGPDPDKEDNVFLVRDRVSRIYFP